MDWKSVTEVLRNLAESLALVAAAGYFVYRWRRGNYTHNSSLSLDLKRQRSRTESKDDLVITANVRRGENWTVELRDARVQVGWDDQKRSVPLVGIDRRSYGLGKSQEADIKHEIVDFAKPSEAKPFLQLAPGDETQYSCWVQVPSDAVCSIELVILGKRPTRSGKIAQWRASAISMPLTLAIAPASNR
jgi:hypothetical protein